MSLKKELLKMADEFEKDIHSAEDAGGLFYEANRHIKALRKVVETLKESPVEWVSEKDIGGEG